MEEVGLEKARFTLGEVVNRARLADQPAIITRNGKPAAMVIPIAWHEQGLRACCGTPQGGSHKGTCHNSLMRGGSGV